MVKEWESVRLTSFLGVPLLLLNELPLAELWRSWFSLSGVPSSDSEERSREYSFWPNLFLSEKMADTALTLAKLYLLSFLIWVLVCGSISVVEFNFLGDLPIVMVCDRLSILPED